MFRAVALLSLTICVPAKTGHTAPPLVNEPITTKPRSKDAKPKVPHDFKWQIDETWDNKNRLRNLLQSQNEASELFRRNAWGMASGWTFPAPAQWQPVNTLGHGFDLRNCPNMGKTTDSIFTGFDVTAVPTFTAQTVVEYLKNDHDAQTFVSNSTGIGLGFAIEDFSIGLNFKSDNMKQISESDTRAYYVVSYSDGENREVKDGSRVSDFARFDWARNRLDFFARYGTHYISSIHTGAHYKVIYTIEGTSRAVVDQFGTDSGLSLGYAGFNADLSQKVKNALKTFDKSIRISSRVTAYGVAGLGEPSSIALDYGEVTKAAERYIKAAKTERSGLFVYSFEIAPYANLFGLQLPMTADYSLASAATGLKEMAAIESDIIYILRYKDYFQSAGTGTPFSNATLDKLIFYRRNLANALSNLLVYASENSLDDLENATRAWRLFAGGEIKNGWPTILPGMEIKYSVDMNTGLVTATLRGPKGSGSSLQKVRRWMTTYNATTPDGTGLPTEVTVLVISVNPQGNLVEYTLEPVKAIADVATPGTNPPVPPTTTWLQVTDQAGYVFERVLATRYGGLVTGPTSFETMIRK